MYEDEETALEPIETEETIEDTSGRIPVGQKLQKKLSGNTQLDYKLYSLSKKGKIIFFVLTTLATAGIIITLLVTGAVGNI